LAEGHPEIELELGARMCAEADAGQRMIVRLMDKCVSAPAFGSCMAGAALP
jgi:hypothetical protein